MGRRLWTASSGSSRRPRCSWCTTSPRRGRSSTTRKGSGLPLTVVYGHDHVASVKRDGTVTLVDAGTSGASGYLTLGQEGSPPYTFQILDFSREPEPRLLSVTTMSYEGLYGKSTATYTPIAR